MEFINPEDDENTIAPVDILQISSEEESSEDEMDKESYNFQNNETVFFNKYSNDKQDFGLRKHIDENFNKNAILLKFIKVHPSVIDEYSVKISNMNYNILLKICENKTSQNPTPIILKYQRFILLLKNGR